MSSLLFLCLVLFLVVAFVAAGVIVYAWSYFSTKMRSE